MVDDNLSRLENGVVENKAKAIIETFPNEQLMTIDSCLLPWYVDYVNYLACGVLPPNLNSQQRKWFLHNVRYYHWDDPFLCADYILRRYIPYDEKSVILSKCHSSPYEGHFGGARTT